MIIRFFDLFFSILGVIVLAPVFFVVYLLIKISSRGGGFFIQERIGKGGKPFLLIKFRSMVINSEESSLITVANDSRITHIGKFIRKYKIDELPQLFNIIKGDMSIVGPRPEVRKYVDLYNTDQKRILSVKPGLTDYASIAFFDESEQLTYVENYEKFYINELISKKTSLNMIYVKNHSLKNYFIIIYFTIKRLLKRS